MIFVREVKPRVLSHSSVATCATGTIDKFFSILIATASSFTGQVSEDREPVCEPGCVEKQRVEEEDDAEYPQCFVFSVNLTSGCVIVARPSYIVWESSRRPSQSCTSRLCSRSSTAAAIESMTCLKTARGQVREDVCLFSFLCRGSPIACVTFLR